jgi:multiple sugar transport system substrate-binding protein
VRDLFSYQGDLKALPQEISSILVYYRKDMLDKYGVKYPPDTGWTWEGLRDACLSIRDKIKTDNLADVFPLVGGWKKTDNAFIAASTLWSNGVDWLDEKTQMPKFSQPGSVDAMKFQLGLLNDDKIYSEGIVDYEYNEVLAAYQQGKAAIAIQWNAAAPTFEDKEKSPETAGKTGYSLFPYFKSKDPNYNHTYAHGHGIAVSAYSKKQQAAFEYLTWFTSKDVARDYVVKGGGSSGRTSVLTDPDIQKQAGLVLQALSKSLTISHRAYATPDLNWILRSVIQPNISNIFTKQRTIEEGLQDADNDLIAGYKDKGYIK